MPEGDTIYRAAQTLSKAIGGKTVVRFQSPLPAIAPHAARLEGHAIERIEARGKNLLIHFDEGTALHTHMRMTGSWHIYRPGEAWQKPQRAARVVIETADFVAVCFNAPVVEILEKGGVDRRGSLARLGPDVLKDDFDPDVARRRLRERAKTPIAEALLDQAALAGIGNVYKSEVLFICRVDPRVPVERLSDETLDRIIKKSRELMAQNLDGHPRTTTRSPRGAFPMLGPRCYVYKRAGEPCLKCGAKIRVTRAVLSSPSADGSPPPPGAPAGGGLAGRVTFWCPGCQPTGAVGEGRKPPLDIPPR
jgi:endonuclease-8